jgi:hypothetical protein
MWGCGKGFRIFYLSRNMYEVLLLNKARKSALKMPLAQQKLLLLLEDDLRVKGPVQPSWMNYSKLSDKTYHCHLSYRWVACWEETEAGLKIEVYYVGSRESAPY